MVRVLLVDNYDSFTYNIAHLFGELGCDVTVMRNDDPALDSDGLAAWDLCVIGPGPGRPSEAGKSLACIASAVTNKHPLFGICLGQQAIGQYFGADVVYAPSLMHGKTSEITHDHSGIFADVPSPFTATRYHSLCLAEASMPAELRVTARSEDGVIQGIAHTTLPIFAVQFHPESILTTAGRSISLNMLALAGTPRGGLQ